MSETLSSELLQSRYLLEIERATMDKEAHGDYTQEGLQHLKSAGEIQMKLASVTEGSVSARHKQMSEELFRQVLTHMKRLGLIEAAPPRPEKQPKPPKAGQPEVKKETPDKTSDGEMEGFRIEDYIVRPGAVKIEEALQSNPHTVKAIKSAVYDDFAERFPNVRGYTSPSVRHRLLYGPPGSGKTYLCKGLATYLNEKYPDGRSCFFLLPCSEIKSKFVGTAEKRIREVFRVAAGYEFSVICIDEVDALCPPRSQDQHVNYTTTLLELIDGVKGKTNSMVILATNHPENVDSALISRIGHRDFIDYASRESLEALLRKEERIAPGLGKTQEERDQAIAWLASSAAEKHFSYRNMNVLCDEIHASMKEKLEEAYPEGSQEELDFIPLSREELERSFKRVNTDFNQEEYTRLLEYRDLHK